jgi:hypothetical protein
MHWNCNNYTGNIIINNLEIKFIHIIIIIIIIIGYAVVQLVEALSYKPEGRGFDSRLT